MMGEPFYWNVRKAQFPSLTAYFEQKFPDNENPLYLAVTTGSNSADSQIAEAHEANGMAGISNRFQRSVGLEVTLSWLASVDHLIKTGDIEGAKSLLAYRPAGTAPSSPAGRRMVPLARARRAIRPTSVPRTVGEKPS